MVPNVWHFSVWHPHPGRLGRFRHPGAKRPVPSIPEGRIAAKRFACLRQAVPCSGQSSGDLRLSPVDPSDSLLPTARIQPHRGGFQPVCYSNAR